MRLGKYSWDTPLFLAPMAGYTDTAFREICKSHGCDLTVTEMVSAKGLAFQNHKTCDLLRIGEAEYPAVCQLFGREPDILADAARRVSEELGERLAAIDLNMGCPAPKIVKNGEGSALMEEPELAGRIIEAMVKSSLVPVTVKMRTGVSPDKENAVEIARIAENSGVSMISIHGRNREQMYSGKADLDKIRLVKEAVSIPVIGNGDVADTESAIRMLRETNCDGLMIGRGALGNPWIFEEIRCAVSGKKWEEPSFEEKMQEAIRHARRTVGEKGEHGVIELRKHIIWYLRGLRGAAATRRRLQKAVTLEELEEILLDTVKEHEYNDKTL